MIYAALQLLVIGLTAAPLIHIAPALDGDARHKIDRIEDDREEALWSLAQMQTRRVT